MTARLKTCVMLLVVMKPKRRRGPARSCAARLGPPVHDQVGAARDLGPGGAQGLGVAVTERHPHALVAHERRVADDEVGLGPVGLARPDVAVHRHAGGLVGHVFAGHRVFLGGPHVPDGHRLAALVEKQLLGVVGEHSVAALDVAVGVQHRLRRLDAAVGAPVPLEVADPQHQLSDLAGPRVLLDAEELRRRDGCALHVQGRAHLVLAQVAQALDDLGLELLEQVEGHDQEVARAAGRVEDAQVAELDVEGLELLDGGFELGAGEALGVGDLALLLGGRAGQQWG